MAEKNIFRQALEILDNRHGDEMTEEERQLVDSAKSFTANILPRLEPEYDNIDIRECLKELTEIIDGHC